MVVASRATRSTRAPSATSCSATACPSPRLAPPTTNDLPLRLSIILLASLKRMSIAGRPSYPHTQPAANYPHLANHERHTGDKFGLGPEKEGATWAAPPKRKQGLPNAALRSVPSETGYRAIE